LALAQPDQLGIGIGALWRADGGAACYGGDDSASQVATPDRLAWQRNVALIGLATSSGLHPRPARGESGDLF